MGDSSAAGWPANSRGSKPFPDDVAIKVVLDNGQGFFLDPKDTEAFLGRGEEDDRDVLELRLGFGASVIVESSPRE